VARLLLDRLPHIQLLFQLLLVPLRFGSDSGFQLLLIRITLGLTISFLMMLSLGVCALKGLARARTHNVWIL
jgi:hypothetical protein